MSRRTLRAALSATALLGVAGLSPAKPPDLPLDHKDTVAPWVAPEGPEPPPGGCVSYTPPGSYPCHPERDVVRTRFAAWLETLPPSVRRRVGTSLLAGVHPLFWLIHPDKMLDFPCDHPAPAAAEEEEDADDLLAATREQTTGSVLFGVGVNAAAGPKGQKSVRQVPAALSGQLPFGAPPAEGEDSPCLTHTLTGILTEEEHPAYELQSEEPAKVTDGKCPSAREKAEKSLSATVNVHFKAAPLREVLVQISDWQGVHIWVNEREVEEAGVNLNCPVTVKLEQVTLKIALGLILHNAGLSYDVRDDGVLEVTAPARRHGAKVGPETRAYRVGHLLPKDGPEEGDVAFLVGLISAATGPGAWASAGGVGTIEYSPAGRTLVVHQTADVHRQVGLLLAGLGEYVGRKTDHAAAPTCCTRPGAPTLSAARPVRELLAGPKASADARPPTKLKLVVEEGELPAAGDGTAGEQEEVAVPTAAARPVSLTPPGCCAEADASARGLRFLCRFPLAGATVQVRYDGGGFTFAVTPAARERAPAGGCEDPR